MSYGKTEIVPRKQKYQVPVLDVVEAVFATNHHLVCSYEVVITKDGVIYCGTCNQQINSLWEYD